MVFIIEVNPMLSFSTSVGLKQAKVADSAIILRYGISFSRTSPLMQSSGNYIPRIKVQHSLELNRSPCKSASVDKKMVKRSGKNEHHLWKKRDSTGSGQKALNLVRIVSDLPNEKEVVYGALDKWIAWELEFPLIAAAKALRILKKRNQWKRVIQVAKWMLSKGQGATMATYDILLLAFDKDRRIEEAESLWNMILHTHSRSISKWLFSRMISLYDHHDQPEKIIEVFADMEELGVKPDADTVRRIARAFQKLEQVDKKQLILKKYGLKWKYVHFKGERVRVRVEPWNDEESDNQECNSAADFLARRHVNIPRFRHAIVSSLLVSVDLDSSGCNIRD